MSLSEGKYTFSETDKFAKAKAFLQKNTSNGHNLYDHLSSVVARVLHERIDDAVDVLEDISRKAKKCKFSPETDSIVDKVDRSSEVALAQVQLPLFKGEGEDVEMEDDAESVLANLMDSFYHFEQIGVGFGREEATKVCLAMKKLTEDFPLQSASFWGKIFGLEQNYYIAEGEFKEGEEEEEEEEFEMESVKAEENEMENSDEESPVDELPKSQYKPPPKVPAEASRTGANKKTYFVCNDPGKRWTKLPNVTPEQIDVSRKIKKYFSGSLNTAIVSYPQFPGSEAEYLRAQIARITASTMISPLGFYHFEEEEEEEEEGAARDNFIENQDFEGISAVELMDKTLANWVHHVSHILPQGRTTWWNPIQRSEENEEEEEEEAGAEDEQEPEVGPPILTPLSEDAEVDSMQVWSTKLHTSFLPQYSIASVHSNLWPGAVSYGTEKKFGNIYIGYGHKYSTQNYSPPPLPPVMEEFTIGPEISEIEDPTAEEEAAFRAAQQEAEEAMDEIEEEEEEDEEEDD